ncbi:hypothetical protein BO71DRAFT_390441 [Aspergillus ellipticus CBS 707.79]|uniref:Xylanolytic transcriptional activator regulatory domain-containing protein n=1 Tax=Aspergillus ellipticus CBS 707.79 TaxID=1448320 RepID=A0A319CUV9_9EURO|nr:hypothetical protein BO71DRAFT_390441 [Aspergillus ellipticus CBS 707.79]
MEVVDFSGETSIRHTLTQVESRLEKIQETETPGRASQVRVSTPGLTPSPHPDGGAKRQGPFDACHILQKYAIAIDKGQGERSLQLFCNEIHIMYPFVHLPTLWKDYANIWDGNFTPPAESDVVGRSKYRMTFARILLCMAVGRCTESPRAEHCEGKYSAGWSLYGAASELLGDPFSSFGNPSDPIQFLQTLALIIIYLFRLDLFGRAEKLLALAISHAHQLGLHRSKVLQKMSPYHSEVARRTWWSLYLLDRRLAIETGHPFVIQDINVDTPLPQDVDDEWLSRSRRDPTLAPYVAPSGETTGAPATPIPYLRAMITYSKVLGKVWEGMYGATSSESSNHPLREHLDWMLSRAQNDVQSEFAHPFPGQHRHDAAETPWWLVKLKRLMRIRWLCLRLMIYKPMLQASFSPSASALDTFDNDVTCMQIANNIIEEFAQIPADKALFTFPFIHYLISAVMISLGLIMKTPTLKAKYGKPILYAVRSLESYCHKTWLSGKMIRVISRLKEMTSYLMDDKASMGLDTPLSRQSSQALPEASDPRSREISRVRSGYLFTPSPGSLPKTPLTGLPLKENLPSMGSPANFHMGRGRPSHSIGYNPATQPQYFAQSSSVPQVLPYPSMANLVMLDFDFEEDVTPTLDFSGMPAQSSSVMQAPPQGSTLTGTTQSIMPAGLTNGGPQFPAAESGGEVGEMEWLEALFGNYFDTGYIVRQQH